MVVGEIFDDERVEGTWLSGLVSHGGGVSGMRTESRRTGKARLGVGCSDCGGETRGGNVRRDSCDGERECGRVMWHVEI